MTTVTPPAQLSGQSLILLGLRLSDPRPALEDRLSGVTLVSCGCKAAIKRSVPVAAEEAQWQQRCFYVKGEGKGGQDMPKAETPTKKKARQGKQLGRIVKEQEWIQVEWHVQQDAVMAVAHKTGDDLLLGLVVAMDVMEKEEIGNILHNLDENMLVCVG
ncbi:hypothetical protein B0H13DRAFT_1922400 [Mycena leptocephala]|nr:hypothetical protein B0H13DRAFT_1922400 [Mycena leptocephala]